jgi:hypothetical protein
MAAAQVCLPQVEQLLGAGPPDGRWEALDDAALDEEVAKYRDALSQLTQRLTSLGASRGARFPASVPVPDPMAPHAPMIARRAGVEADLIGEGASGAGVPADQSVDPLGVEGVDYAIGSVDDLDPSEWQVQAAVPVLGTPPPPLPPR